jgi:DNA mismatch repair protein MutS
MSLIEKYFEDTKTYKKSHGEKTIILIQVGSFFECYAIVEEDGSYSGSSIEEFSRICDMSIARKNTCVGTKKVVMAGFGLTQLEKYVKRLLENGYTVPVITQNVQAKGAQRNIACIYSPGMYFNDDSDNLSNNTICIWLNVSKSNSVIKEPLLTVGLSIIDILTGKLINFEYTIPYNNNPIVYDNLEKYISVHNPSEAIIITNNLERDYIDNVINYINLKSSKIHKILLEKDKEKTDELVKIGLNCEKQKFQESLVDKLYGVGSFREISEFYQYPIANQSLCFLLDFVEKHNPNLIKDISLPDFENHTEKLVLANHSLKQLNIISDNNYSGKLSSISSMLNNCITSIGKRKFNYELLHPTSNIDELNKSYNITEHLVETKFYNVIRDELNSIRDIERIERKLIMNKLEPRDFYMLFYNLSKIKVLFQKISQASDNLKLYEYISSIINSKIDIICDEVRNFVNNKFNVERINNIVLDKLGNYNIEDLDFINKNYDKDLHKQLRETMDAKEVFEAIRKYLSDVIKKYEKNKESEFVKIHETSKSDSFLLATKRRAVLLQDSLKKEENKVNIQYLSKFTRKDEIYELDLSSLEFIEHGSNKTNMIITSPELKKMASSIQNDKELLINRINLVYSNILREFIEFNNKSKLSIISQFIGLIDTVHNRAYNVNKFNHTKPVIIDNYKGKSYFTAKQIRHPLIEQLNQNELYVSNDIELGSNFNCYLIYGTNAVGKSSLIKSIGINIILAQSGNYVSCSNFIYYPYNSLFTRILNTDNIFKGLSTFALEMSELRNILKYSDKNSIVLGDELCSGTESISGLSIFTASLERLHNNEVSSIFATHYHELLKYDEIKNLNKLKINHMSVIFDKKSNKLIYDRKLKEGSGEMMYGIQVAESLDLDFEFIERCYSIRNKYNENNNTLIDSVGSSYNAKKIKEKICEICNLNPSVDIHHLQFQENANSNGFINNEFNKNNKANLISICQTCHNKIHKENRQMKKVKTSKGYQLTDI